MKKMTMEDKKAALNLFSGLTKEQIMFALYERDRMFGELNALIESLEEKNSDEDKSGSEEAGTPTGSTAGGD